MCCCLLSGSFLYVSLNPYTAKHVPLKKLVLLLKPAVSSFELTSTPLVMTSLQLVGHRLSGH